jgi:hypothetical protein
LSCPAPSIHSVSSLTLAAAALVIIMALVPSLARR